MALLRANLMLILLAIVSASVRAAPASSLTCPVGWIGWQEHCYYFSKGDFEDVRDWDEAQARCKELAGSGFTGHLASIHSYAENQFIYDTFQSMPVHPITAFIGLRQFTIGGPYSWDDDTPLDYTYWMSGYPSYSGEDCTEMPQERQNDGYTGHWMSFMCTTAFEQSIGYVCKTQAATPDSTDTTPEPLPTLPDPSEGCPPDWIGWQSNCYFFSTGVNDRALDCQHAQELCEKMGSNLTSVLSQAENNFLYLNMYRRGLLNTYIGLRQYEAGTDKPFFWTDGSAVNFTNWGSFSSGEQAPFFYYETLPACAYFYDNFDGAWIDQIILGGDSMAEYVCKTKRATVTSGLISTTLSTTIPDCIPDGQSCSQDAEDSYKMCCSNVCFMGVCSSTS